MYKINLWEMFKASKYVIIIVWLFIIALIYKSIFTKDASSFEAESQSKAASCTARDEEHNELFWKNIDFHKKEIPENIHAVASQLQVASNFIQIQDSKVHYLNAKPKLKRNLSVLLLHGHSFTAETWNKLNTIQIIAAFGYYAVAIDLPGYGHTPAVENLNKTDFLSDVIKTLNLENVVIVSPSMSGSFSLDFILKHPTNTVGFVPISPVGTHILNKKACKDKSSETIGIKFDKDCQKLFSYLNLRDIPDLNCIKIPTLVVFGEKDKGKNSAKLCLLSQSHGAEIPGGLHAAYLSNPTLWHKLLYNFLDVLSNTVACG